MITFPAIRVTRLGPSVDRVEWVDGDMVVDLTPLRVTQIERNIVVVDMPAVKVTFQARLVEVEA